MKNFTYVGNDKFNLRGLACEWLKDMGLRETRWILDREWFLAYYSHDNKQITFEEWVKE